jgi:putative ABC transport system substrate-binding protein
MTPMEGHMAIHIRRREFIITLGSAAAAWPLAARAQQPAKLPTIGFLGALSPAASTQWTTAFLNRLRELGWTDGRNVAIVHRWLEGRTERAGELAAELGPVFSYEELFTRTDQNQTRNVVL